MVQASGLNPQKIKDWWQGLEHALYHDWRHAPDALTDACPLCRREIDGRSA